MGRSEFVLSDAVAAPMVCPRVVVNGMKGYGDSVTLPMAGEAGGDRVRVGPFWG
jgi:hypothetical protein